MVATGGGCVTTVAAAAGRGARDPERLAAVPVNGGVCQAAPGGCVTPQFRADRHPACDAFTTFNYSSNR